MKKQLLITLTILASTATFSFAQTVSQGSNTQTNSDNSVSMGRGNSTNDSEKANVMGGSNAISSSINSNTMGDSNKVTNSNNSSLIGNTNTVNNADNASIIGNNNSVSGTNNVAIGNNNNVSGDNSIAIGGGTASNGGIAIGSGSAASKADEVNFGDRTLTGVKAGVADTDAANVGQLNQKAGETLQNANDYTDTKVPTVINEANQYTDYQYNQAVNQLFEKNKGYIDAQANRLDKKIDNYKSEAFAGVAGAMAMASIPKKEGYRTSWGMGVSNYKNQQAIAAGVEHNTTDKTVIKFNFSSDTQGGIGVGAGFAFGAN